MVLRHFRYSILVCYQDVPVAHQDGIADLAPQVRGVMVPVHLPVLHDIHSQLLALSSIEEIVTAQTVALCHQTRSGKYGQ